MPTPNLIVRTPPDLRRLLEARAEREHCSLSDVARSAMRTGLNRDDSSEALERALRRAEAAEAKVKRLEKALASARKGVVVMDVATAKQARAGEREARDARLVSALEAATAQDPATAPRLAALTGYAALWCRDLLRALGEAGYLEKTGTGQPIEWVPVPGRDIDEGVKAAKALAQRGPNRVPPRRQGKPASPALVVFKPAAQ